VYQESGFNSAQKIAEEHIQALEKVITEKIIREKIKSEEDKL
jgi:hypothetical protein